MRVDSSDSVQVVVALLEDVTETREHAWDMSHSMDAIYESPLTVVVDCWETLFASHFPPTTSIGKFYH